MRCRLHILLKLSNHISPRPVLEFMDRRRPTLVMLGGGRASTTLRPHERRGWSAFADHDGNAASKMRPLYKRSALRGLISVPREKVPVRRPSQRRRPNEGRMFRIQMPSRTQTTRGTCSLERSTRQMTKRQIGSGRVLTREWRPGESPDGESGSRIYTTHLT